MIRRILPVFCAAVLLFAAVPAYAAVEPDDVVEAVRDEGFYIESGVSASEARVSSLINIARNEGSRLMIVVLAEDPPGGASTFADAVLDRVGDGIVMVLTPETYGSADQGDFFTTGDIADALERANSQGGDDNDFLSNFIQALYVDAALGVTTTQASSVGDAPATAAPASSSGGGTGVVWFLVIVGAIGLLGFWWVRSQKKRSEVKRERYIAEARTEIQKQLDAVANEVIDLEDRVRVADNDQADVYFQRASKTYADAAEAFEASRSLDDLEHMSDRLDEAAWQLDSAEAILEGRPVPPKPERAGRCFFDPTHKPPYEDATLETNAGKRTVKVCRDDAERLRQGQEPKPRMINVGGRGVPAASAPRSHGGLGMGGLDILSIVLGGMSMGRSLGWGGGSSRRRGGMFGRSSPMRTSRSRGGGILGRGGVTPRSRRSSTRTRSRTRTRTRGRTGGRRRR